MQRRADGNRNARKPSINRGARERINSSREERRGDTRKHRRMEKLSVVEQVGDGGQEGDGRISSREGCVEGCVLQSGGGARDEERVI